MAQISKLTKWGLSRCVVIPKPIWKELGWKLYDPLLVTSQNGVIVIQPVQIPDTPRVTNAADPETVAE